MWVVVMLGKCELRCGSMVGGAIDEYKKFKPIPNRTCLLKLFISRRHSMLKDHDKVVVKPFLSIQIKFNIFF